MSHYVPTIEAEARNTHPELCHLLDYISAHPERSGKEVKASQCLTDFLAGEGFRVTMPFEGCPTGFLAEYRSGSGPKIVYLAKYNALPNFDANGKDAHGCGHNWVAALAVGSAAVLKKAAGDFQGTIAVIGAPEESFFFPRVGILQSDYFKDAAAVFAAHLNDENLLHSFPLPINALEFEIFGERSQAFSFPHKGINAVDCAIDALTEIRAIRSQLADFDRINYTLAESSDKVDFIPDYARIRVSVGGTTVDRAVALTDKVKSVFESTASRYGAKLQTHVANEFRELVNLESMHQLIENCFRDIGESYLVMPRVLGRTQLDIAQVSHLCPLLYMFFGVPNWISHQPTLERIEASHSDAAKEKLLKAVRIFAQAGLRVMKENGLRTEIENEFKKCTKHS